MRLPKFLSRRSASSIPDGPLDLNSAAFLTDPYPIYRALRAKGAAHVTSSGAILLLDHADVKAAMSHPDLGNAPSRYSALAPRFRDTRVAADVAANIPPFQDRPEHIFTRRALSRAFSRRVSDIAGSLRGAADAVVGRAPSSCDLVRDVASPFATGTMRRLIGLDGVGDDAAKSYSEAFFHLFAPLTDAGILARANSGLSAFRDVAVPLVAARRVDPGMDLISYLVETEIDGRRLSDTEIADLALLVLADGIENIEAAVVTAMILLNEAAVAALSRGETGAIVDEVLRLETPAQLVPRIARRDTEVAGTSCKAEMPVLLGLGAANRDPVVFPEPDRFDPGRDHTDVLTFGKGRHSCIGAPLARDMIGAMTEALVARGARVARRAEIEYAHRFGHRWPLSVTVEFR